jgi:hypothetical protein
MRSLVIPGAIENAVLQPASGLKKIDNFLPNRLRLGIVFSKTEVVLAMGQARPGPPALRGGSDSLIAPQAIGIAQNGLANVDPPA